MSKRRAVTAIIDRDTDASGDPYVGFRKHAVNKKINPTTSIISEKIECFSREMTASARKDFTGKTLIYGIQAAGMPHSNSLDRFIDMNKDSICTSFVEDWTFNF